MLQALYVLACAVLAMLAHELGHYFAARKCHVPASEIGMGAGPRLCGVRLGSLQLNLRLYPIGSFVRLDGDALYSRPLSQQLFIHAGGVLMNLLLAVLAHGTFFGYINLILGVTNMLPLYQQDGWKCGVALMRALLHRRSRPVEWVFTFSGGLSSIILGYMFLRLLLI